MRKIILIPSIDDELFPEAQIEEIRLANESESPESDPRRKAIEAALASQSPPASATLDFRASFARRLREISESTDMGKKAIRDAIGSDTLGKSPTWGELNDFLPHLLLHLHNRKSGIALGDACEADIHLKDPTDLMLARATSDFRDDLLSDAYRTLSELLGVTDATLLSMIDLIRNGMALDRHPLAADDPKSDPDAL